jgi:tetratricopeptide (TPR) repeat protein
MTDPIFTKAIIAARRGKFTKAIEILNPEVTYYRDSAAFLYFFGLCYLRKGDTANSLPLFRSAALRDPGHLNTLIALAVLHLRRGEGPQAAELYLKIKDIDASNKFARKGLDTIKKYPSPELLLTFSRTKNVKGLYPPFPKVPLTPARVIAPVLAVTAVFAIAAGIYAFAAGKISLPKLPVKEARAGLSEAALTREDRSGLIDTRGSFSEVWTVSQIEKQYEAALRFFAKYEDESARRELNRILLSNAGEGVKNKTRHLLTLLNKPDWTSLKERFSFAEVKANPRYYEGCHVIWSGRAANISEAETSTYFDFLVGYDKGAAFEGIVSAVFDFAVKINGDLPLEVFGEIVPQGSAFALRGIAVHQSPVR